MGVRYLVSPNPRGPAMARTVSKVANILSDMYEETFSSDSESFRINWADLRGIAGVIKLYPIYLRKINKILNKTGIIRGGNAGSQGKY